MRVLLCGCCCAGVVVDNLTTRVIQISSLNNVSSKHLVQPNCSTA